MAQTLTRLISRFGRPQPGPGRVQRVFREFDETRGFALYHEKCRQVFERNLLVGGASPLSDLGFEYLDILPYARAASLREILTERYGIASVKKNSEALVGFRDIDDEFRNEILDTVLTPLADERILSFFASEYLVLWMIVTATEAAAADEIVSFKWHCDRGPSQHLKLIVYLNPSQEHGGNTEFIPLSDSRRIGDSGYVFGSTRKRTNSVQRLSRLAGKPVETVLQPIPAGGGVLFQPANVVHRGVAPDRGTRYAITLCLLPSPVPWRAALERGLLYDLNTDEKWPAHASELMRMLEE